MAGDNAARRLRLWSGLVLFCVFLAGGVAGAGVFAWWRPPAHSLKPHRDLPQHFNELDMTAEQREKANAIFAKHRATVESILKQNFPRVRAANEQTEREFRSILTDVQNKKLDEIEARRPPPGRHQGWMGGAPPGAPGYGQTGDKSSPEQVPGSDGGMTGDVARPGGAAH